jgi:hypothetical protein
MQPQYAGVAGDGTDHGPYTAPLSGSTAAASNPAPAGAAAANAA